MIFSIRRCVIRTVEDDIGVFEFSNLPPRQIATRASRPRLTEESRSCPIPANPSELGQLHLDRRSAPGGHSGYRVAADSDRKELTVSDLHPLI